MCVYVCVCVCVCVKWAGYGCDQTLTSMGSVGSKVGVVC